MPGTEKTSFKPKSAKALPKGVVPNSNRRHTPDTTGGRVKGSLSTLTMKPCPGTLCLARA